jgi:hypothetical protein
MQADPRLTLDPSSVAYHLARQARENQVRQLHDAEAWVALVDPLADFFLAHAEGHVVPVPSPPVEFDESLVASWNVLGLSLVSHAAPTPANPEAYAVLSQQLGTRIAARVGEQPARWDAILEVLSNSGQAWDAFCDNLDPDAIRSNLTELTALPAQVNALDLFESFDRPRGDETLRYRADRLADLRAQSSDLWSYVEETTRGAEDIILIARLRGRSRLLFRAGEEHLVAWLAALPLPVLSASALREVADLNVIENLISSRLAKASSGEDWLLVLLLRYAFDRWRRIESQLCWAGDRDRWASPWSADPNELAAYELQLAQWRDTELPERARHVAAMLVGTAAGRTVAILALRHLFEWTWQPREPRAALQIVGRVRAALVAALLDSCSDLPALVSAIIDGLKVPAALLGAATLVVAADQFPTDQRNQARRQVLDGYRDWLLAGDCTWSQDLREDEFNLAWTLARLLAAGEGPALDFHRLLTSCCAPTEGWLFDLDRVASSIPKLAHVLTVGALATEWLARVQLVDQARCLFALVWECLHRLMRSTAEYEFMSALATPLAHTWARLWLVWQHAGDAAAMEQFRTIDRIEWLLAAAQNFSRNRAVNTSDERALPVELQSVLRCRFDELFRTWRLCSHVTQRDVESYLAEMTRLAADALPSIGLSG